MVLASLPDTAGLVPALTAGAHGCLLKTIPPEHPVLAIRQVIAGAPWVQPELTDRFARDRATALSKPPHPVEPDRPLTRREMEVLRLIVAGYSNAEIARELHISEQTVKTHLAHLMRKIEVRSRLQAARYAIRRGLVEV
jgi:DNA-binding NarL/FixJ family response regulator